MPWPFSLLFSLSPWLSLVSSGPPSSPTLSYFICHSLQPPHWCFERADWHKFTSLYSPSLFFSTLDMFSYFTVIVLSAAFTAILRTSQPYTSKCVPWWNTECLAQLRCIKNSWQNCVSKITSTTVYTVWRLIHKSSEKHLPHPVSVFHIHSTRISEHLQVATELLTSISLKQPRLQFPSPLYSLQSPPMSLLLYWTSLWPHTTQQ